MSAGLSERKTRNVHSWKKRRKKQKRWKSIPMLQNENDRVTSFVRRKFSDWNEVTENVTFVVSLNSSERKISGRVLTGQHRHMLCIDLDDIKKLFKRNCFGFLLWFLQISELHIYLCLSKRFIWPWSYSFTDHLPSPSQQWKIYKKKIYFHKSTL